MLSIHKLVAGHARYYLDQAEGRVDAVESIGDGVEEYYVGGSEARGEWMGAGARQLELTGAVAGEHLRGVLEGFDRDGLSLRDSPCALRNAGYDMTVSAPKSVSVLFALGDPMLQRAVRSAHDRAVREAFGHVERTAAAVRRGHGGARVEPADGLIAAAFRHRTSRAGDPQLHTHVLVANLGRGPDGRWTALDGRRLYAQARTTSFIYQAVLRSELTRSLGVEWLPVRDGIAEIAGVPRAGDARVQPSPRGDRGRVGATSGVGAARRGGGGARDPTAEGPQRECRAAGRRVARARRAARVRPRGARAGDRPRARAARERAVLGARVRRAGGADRADPGKVDV